MEINEDMVKITFSEPHYFAYKLYFKSEMTIESIDIVIKSKNVYDETINNLRIEFEIYKNNVLKVLEIKELWGVHDNKITIYKIAEEFAKKLESKKEKRQSLEIILKKFLAFYFAKITVFCQQTLNILRPVYKELRELKKQQLKSNSVPHEPLSLSQAEEYKKRKETNLIQQT